MNTKVSIKDGALNMVESFTSFLEAVKEGMVNDVDVMDALIKVAMAEKAITEFKSALKPYSMDALSRMSDKTAIDLGNAYVKVTTTPRKYNYAISKDWKIAQSEVEIATNKRKAIEAALRDAHINEYVDKATGEIISSIECISGGEKTIAVTLR